jgi:hypothetical protein
MPRACLTLVGLLVVLTTASGLAQTAEEFSIQRLPSLDQSPQTRSQDPGAATAETLVTYAPIDLDGFAEVAPAASVRDFLGYRYAASALGQSSQVPPSQDPSLPADETPITGTPITLDGSAEAPPAASLRDFLGYRYLTSSLDWIPGGGNQFGMFSIAWDHYVKSGIGQNIGLGAGFYFLSGPNQTDMPAIVFDFSAGYQIRQRLGPLAFDLSAAVLAASDFKGCARKGILFPSHAVGFLSVSPTLDLVFGVDYLDRGDIKLLPVAGLIWTPNTQRRFELVFPRPRAVFQLSDHHRLYVAGELGGGTWAIERMNFENDLATYRDLRVCIGVECVDKGGERSALEIAYLFDRRLEYTSGLGNMRLDDAIMLRLVTRY